MKPGGVPMSGRRSIVLHVPDVIEGDAVEVIEPLQFPGEAQVLLRLEQSFNDFYDRG